MNCSPEPSQVVLFFFSLMLVP